MLDAFKSIFSQGSDPMAPIKDALNQTMVADKLERLKKLFEQNKLTYPMLVWESTQESNKGQSALWWIAMGANATDEYREFFNKVWDQFGNDIPLEILLKPLAGGKFAGRSILWWLASASQTQPDLFLLVWNKFKNHIPLEALLGKAKEGTNQGQSILWWLAGAAANQKPEAFLSVWDHFKDKIQLKDLLGTADDGEDIDISILGLLGVAAGKGNEAPFVAIEQRFANEQLDNFGPDILTLAGRGVPLNSSYMNIFNLYKTQRQASSRTPSSKSQKLSM